MACCWAVCSRAVAARIKRAQGHLDGGNRVLEERRECECEDVAGVGLAELERLIEVADAECEAARPRRPLLRRWSKRRSR